jgi:NitT/TauT family transport system ATP-binding protein
MVSVSSVSKEFRSSKGDRIQAIKEISLHVSKGEFVSIVGHSGCGKTTLLKIVAGLLRPTSGSVTVDGKLVSKPLTEVGMVFQHPLLMPWRTVIANVKLPAELLGRDTPDQTRRAEDLLSTFGLSSFGHLYPKELSGGMQQRAALARALVHDPSLLLLDEPFGPLDELTREEMGIELARTTESLKKTVLFVTHSVPEAVLLSDRVIVLSPRPSTSRMELPIPLGRPRRPSVRSDPEYLRCCETLRRALGVPIN